MADGWLGSIELKFLARDGFDIGSHQVQTKGRAKVADYLLIVQSG